MRASMASRSCRPMSTAPHIASLFPTTSIFWRPSQASRAFLKTRQSALLNCGSAIGAGKSSSRKSISGGAAGRGGGGRGRGRGGGGGGRGGGRGGAGGAGGGGGGGAPGEGGPAGAAARGGGGGAARAG